MNLSLLQPARIRHVALVDNDVLALHYLINIINKMDKMTVCWTEKDGSSAFDHIQRSMSSIRSMPDLMLVDISMRGMSGIDLCEAVRYLSESIILLGITSYESSIYIEDAAHVGMQGIIEKDHVKELPKAIETVLSGGIWPLSMNSIFQTSSIAHQKIQGKGKPFILKLSPQERQIITLCTQGFSTNEISEQLSISSSTVKTHISRIIAKFNVTSKREAVALWSQKVRF